MRDTNIMEINGHQSLDIQAKIIGAANMRVQPICKDIQFVLYMHSASSPVYWQLAKDTIVWIFYTNSSFRKIFICARFEITTVTSNSCGCWFAC